MRNELNHVFLKQRAHAKERGIPFLLTFGEWLDIWTRSGKLEKRGKGRGRYCMARFNDQGAYQTTNVEIIPYEKNLSDAHCGERHPQAKLTWQKVQQIREEYVFKSREHNISQLARRYGVSYCAIQRVVSGIGWIGGQS